MLLCITFYKTFCYYNGIVGIGSHITGTILYYKILNLFSLYIYFKSKFIQF